MGPLKQETRDKKQEEEGPQRGDNRREAYRLEALERELEDLGVSVAYLLGELSRLHPNLEGIRSRINQIRRRTLKT